MFLGGDDISAARISNSMGWGRGFALRLGWKIESSADLIWPPFLAEYLVRPTLFRPTDEKKIDIYHNLRIIMISFMFIYIYFVWYVLRRPTTWEDKVRAAVGFGYESFQPTVILRV